MSGPSTKLRTEGGATGPRPSTMSIPDRLQHLIRGRSPSDDRALRPDHRQRRSLELRKIALGRVLGEQAFVAAVVGLAHRRLHADFRGNAGEYQLLGAKPLQRVAEAGGVEGALAGF